MEDVSRFFEKGYSTKQDADRHGLGLYNAKLLVGRYHGDITVSLDKADGKDTISMKVVV